MAPRPYWKGHIRLSLVSFEVQLYTASRAAREFPLHQIDKKSGERIRYQTIVPGKGAVPRDEIIKGYEYEKDHYVLFEPEELEKLKLESKHTIDLVQFVDTHDIDARDHHVNVVRHRLAVHLGPKHRISVHEVFGNDAGAQYFALIIGIMQIHVQRFDALLETAREFLPFAAIEDTRNDVEGDQAFGRGRFAVNREGDADAAEDEFGFLAAIIENVFRDRVEPMRELLVGRAHGAVGRTHLVKK